MTSTLDILKTMLFCTLLEVLKTKSSKKWFISNLY